MPEPLAVPVFSLYGEHKPWPTPDRVHCESIAARSALHNWQIRPHRHVGLFQMLYLRGGDAEVQLDDKHYRMANGQVLIVPQMCIHGFRFSQDAVGHVVTLAYPLIDQLMLQAEDEFVVLTSSAIVPLGDDNEGRAIAASFDSLSDEYATVGSHRSLHLQFLLGSLLIRLARHASSYSLQLGKGSSKAERHFGKFLRLVEKHYRKQYSVVHYSDLLGITAAHLNSVCRLIASRSALELIHDRILLEAKRNLIYTSMNISVIAYALGFTDPAYFTRFFKRQVGVSPKSFRQATE